MVVVSRKAKYCQYVWVKRENSLANGEEGSGFSADTCRTMCTQGLVGSSIWHSECKSRKSRNTWSNGQIWPWNVEWSRAKINRVLPRKCTGHSKHPLPTTQENTLHMDITRWSTLKSDWVYSLQPKMEKLYTVNKSKTRSWLWLGPWTHYQIQTEIEESRENQ